MKTGTIKTLVAEKKFGFIAPESGSEVFFHYTALSGVTFEELQVGDKITYEEEVTEKGLRAKEGSVSRVV